VKLFKLKGPNWNKKNQTRNQNHSLAKFDPLETQNKRKKKKKQSILASCKVKCQRKIL